MYQLCNIGRLSQTETQALKALHNALCTLQQWYYKDHLNFDAQKWLFRKTSRGNSTAEQHEEKKPPADCCSKVQNKAGVEKWQKKEELP